MEVDTHFALRYFRQYGAPKGKNTSTVLYLEKLIKYLAEKDKKDIYEMINYTKQM